MINRLSLIPVIFLTCGLGSQAADTPTNAPDATPPPATSLQSTTTPASTTAPAPPTTTDATPTERPATYTVVTGDTLWDLSHKFNCSVSSLKKLNKLKKNHLKLGQVLKIPPARATTSKPTTSDESAPSDKAAKKETATLTETSTSQKPASAKKTKKSSDKIAKSDTSLASPDLSVTLTAKEKKRRHAKALAAQPVQDFDIPASTFASCPTPPGNDPDAVVPDETTEAVPSPTDEAATPNTRLSLPPETSSTTVAQGKTTPVSTASAAKSIPVHGGVAAVPTTPKTQSPASRTFASAIADFFRGSNTPSESGQWGNKFLSQTRDLAARGIGYNQSWRPEGEDRSWAMDCSNTSRYLYRVTAGIELPRTASDQYYYLHLQNKAWDVPTVRNGFADCNFLRSNLKPGDLLFWENTYRPDRQPPITHVMIFLGTNEKGQWIMAGSQSGHGGEFNPHRSGPDVYVFDPTHSSGGYTTWLGLVHHQGRFCAYGRPLEADAKKLSVAAND